MEYIDKNDITALIVEPVFGHLRGVLHLDHFTLRSKRKEKKLKKRKFDLFFIISPIFVIIITQTTALLFGEYFKLYIYIPIIIVYWIILSILLSKYGLFNIKSWLKKPKGHIFWLILSVLIGFSSLPMFLKHYKLFNNLNILIPHIIFFIINPWIEEFYWRGLLIDITKKWPFIISILYSSIFFTFWHTAFSWQSESTRTITFYLPVMILGIIMGLIYKKTKSLWYCIFSHMLINLLNMSIPVLLNMVKI